MNVDDDPTKLPDDQRVDESFRKPNDSTPNGGQEPGEFTRMFTPPPAEPVRPTGTAPNAENLDTTKGNESPPDKVPSITQAFLSSAREDSPHGHTAPDSCPPTEVNAVPAPVAPEPSSSSLASPRTLGSTSYTALFAMPNSAQPPGGRAPGIGHPASAAPETPPPAKPAPEAPVGAAKQAPGVLTQLFNAPEPNTLPARNGTDDFFRSFNFPLRDSAAAPPPSEPKPQAGFTDVLNIFRDGKAAEADPAAKLSSAADPEFRYRSEPEARKEPGVITRLFDVRHEASLASAAAETEGPITRQLRAMAASVNREPPAQPPVFNGMEEPLTPPPLPEAAVRSEPDLPAGPSQYTIITRAPASAANGAGPAVTAPAGVAAPPFAPPQVPLPGTAVPPPPPPAPSWPQFPQVAPPAPTLPQVAAPIPPSPQAAAIPKAPQGAPSLPSKANWIPLLIAFNILFILAVALVLYFALKH